MSKKKTETLLESISKQKHAGAYWSNVYDDTRHMWHTNSEGNYWTGYMPHNISPEDLFDLTLSTLQDLMKNHPELSMRNRTGK